MPVNFTFINCLIQSDATWVKDSSNQIKSNLFANTKYERKKQTENQKKSKM